MPDRVTQYDAFGKAIDELVAKIIDLGEFTSTCGSSENVTNNALAIKHLQQFFNNISVAGFIEKDPNPGVGNRI